MYVVILNLFYTLKLKIIQNFETKILLHEDAEPG